MKAVLLFAMQAIAILSIAQDCHRAYWVDAYDGSQANESFIDVDRHPAGGFVVCGKHAADGTTIGGMTINTGSYGYYLARMDSAGNVSQLVSLFSQDGIDLKRIIVLPDGSVAAGCTVGANITLGSETFHMHGGVKPLLIKFDPNFQYQWHRASQNTSNTSQMRDISCDSESNIYWGGTFSGDDLWFGGNFHLHRTTDGSAWLSKITSQGDFQWLRGIGAGTSVGLQTVTVDSNDDVWITGQASLSANGQIKFSDQIIAPGYLNSAFCMYAAKYDADGVCIWGKITSSSATNGSIYTADAMSDDIGNMYICGNMSGTYNWGPMAMIGGDGGGYLMSLDTDGNGRWFKTMGGQGTYEYATNMDVRGDRISVVGTLSSNQPYVGNFPVYSLATGTYKAFNAQFYTNGELEFCRMNQNDTQNFLQLDVVIDESFNQLVFGYFKGTNVQWYPFSLTHTGTNPKMFVAKFGPSIQTAFSISAGPDKITTCGTNVQLSASTTPATGVGFGWWTDMGFSGNYSKTPAVNIASPNDYIFYGHYQGCIKRDTVHVDLSNYNLSITANESIGICIGDTADLNAISSDPTAIIAWTPNYRITSTTSLTTSTFTNTSLNYIVEATVNGCKARDTVAVTVNRKPAIVIPYQQFYGSYQMHTCIDNPIEAELGLAENSYTIDPATNITWQNDHSVIFGTDQPYYGGIISSTTPEGCSNQITFTMYAYDYQPAPPIINQPNDTIYLCPANGYVYEEEFMITTDIYYLPDGFNYSWYSGWQVDSLDGLGWRDITYYNYGHYELFPNSVGYPTSAYYVPLRFWNVEPTMDGFKYRAYINDICSNRAYTDQMILRVGPAITEQTSSLNICEAASDTLFVEAANYNDIFQWQVFRNNQWLDLLTDEEHIQILDNQLVLVNASAGMDSLFRCRIQGCSPEIFTYSNPIPVEVQTNNIQIDGPYQSLTCLGENIILNVAATGGSFEYNWLRDGQILASNTPGHQGINNDSLVIATSVFDPSQHLYSCQLYNAQCGQSFATTQLSIEVLTPPVIVWDIEDSSFCVNDGLQPIVLALPAGGTYEGVLLNDNFIDPSQHAPGAYVILYTYQDEQGCASTLQKNITIQALPVVNLELDLSQACIPAVSTSINFFPTPENSFISSENLIIDNDNNQFEIPLNSGPYAIHLGYTDEHGCYAETISSFEVLDTVAIEWVVDLGTFCINQSEVMINAPLPVGGIFSPYAVAMDSLQIDGIPNGNHTLNYQITNSNGCVSSRSAEFQVQEIVITWTDSLLAGCVAGEPIPFGDPNPEGGIFSGPGVNGSMFYPAQTGVGFYPVSYTYSDALTGCSASIVQYVQVYEEPVLNFVMTDHDLCEDQGPVSLSEGVPVDGTYSGDGVEYLGIDAAFVQPADLTVGEHVVTYTYTDDAGCSASVEEHFWIHPTPILTWPDSLGIFCTNDDWVEIPAPSPQGGVFGPDIISGDLMHIEGLAPDQYFVQYVYVDDYGCGSYVNSSFTIADTLALAWTSQDPLEPNDGFSICGNFTENLQLDLNTWISPANGQVWLNGNVLENNLWQWNEFFEEGLYNLTLQMEDPETGCLSSLTQEFLLMYCTSITKPDEQTITCWSDSKNTLQVASPMQGYITVYNALGQLLHQSSLRAGQQALQFSTAASFLYVSVELQDGSQEIFKVAMGLE
jgi:hypothetical protein